jgi:hypothetical protein
MKPTEKRNDFDKRLSVLIEPGKCLAQQDRGDYASGKLPGADVVKIL